MIDFKGKTALVTGAAGAIGGQVAMDLNKLGATVFITDLDQAAVAATAGDVSAEGNECKGLAAEYMIGQAVNVTGGRGMH